MEGSFKMRHKTVEDAEEGREVDVRSEHKKKKPDKGKSKKSKGPFPGFRKNIYEYFVEYSSSTSIQGLRYVGDQERSSFERLTWMGIFCVSLYICLYLIAKTYIKWDTSPVLVSFAQSPTPVWKIPFPAITVCSETKARQTVYNFTENYYRLEDDPANMTEEEKKKFGDIALLCDTHLYQQGNLTTGYEAIEFLMEVAPDSEELVWLCLYPYSNKTCQDYFTPILTDDGLCYTFNMLDRSEVFRDNVFLFGNSTSQETKSEGWTLGQGYPKSAQISTYPRRAVSAGIQSKFTIILRAYEQDLDYLCKGPVQGFKIILHNPAETPRLGMHFFRASHLQELNLAVKPDMITTSDGLKNYDPHRRQCYFPEERYLAFFRSYSQQNCELECLANFTKTNCGCVAYYMPHEEETPICGSGSIVCMLQARNAILHNEAQLGLRIEELEINGHSVCDCLPGCTSLVYNAETSQADFSWDNLIASYRDNVSAYEGTRVTRINVFFKEQQFITSERNELYGLTDFIANCGGLLGLFTGFSFLSFIEIIYFLSLRLMCNVKRYGRHYWSGSQELVNNDMYDHDHKK